MIEISLHIVYFHILYLANYLVLKKMTMYFLGAEVGSEVVLRTN